MMQNVNRASTQHRIVVLILSYNGLELLDEAISSYLANDYSNFEVIVIDNGSTDNTKKYVTDNWPMVTVLRSDSNLGYSGGFNYGLKYAFSKKNADFVIVSNNDVMVDKQLITSFVNVTTLSADIGFVIGKIYYYDYPSKIQTVGYVYDDLNWIKPHDANRKEDRGANDYIEERYISDDVVMLTSRKVYDMVGGYDPTIKFQAEQFDWQVRAKKCGFKVYYTPYAKAWHKESYTIGKSSPFKTFYDARNSLVVRLKHRDREYLSKYFPWFLKYRLFRPLLRYIYRFKFRYMASLLSGFSSAIVWGIRNDKIGLRGFK